jgi:ComEC/Rec2-related protein
LDFAFPHIQARGKRFRLQLLERPADWVTRLQSGFYYWLKRRFEKYPGLLGWELALWTGSEEKLPEKLSEFFREAGLSHLLAMSGQRVFGLSIILSLLLSVGLRFGADRVFRHGSRLLPVSCSLLLFLSSGGAPSIRRVLAMAVVLLLIRLRKWHCSSFQTACSSVGCAIAVEPDLLSRPAFLLSVGGCALLVQLVGTGGVRRGFRSYLFIVGLMPLFVLPLNAFFFAKVAWLGFLNCLLVSWLWDFFLIPVGFSLPAVSYCLPAWGMQKLENLWQQLLRFQLWIATGVGGAYRNVVRLTWYEVVLCEGLLLSLVVIFLRRFASARRRN